MLISLAINFIISLCVIIVLHYLYDYLKNSMTTPIVKDLVNKPTQKYNKIYNILNEKPSDEDKEKMKMELKSFIKGSSTVSQNNEIENENIKRVNETGFETFSGNAEYSAL